MASHDSRQSSSLCGAFIEVGNDPWAGTYCKLRTGHDGDHSPLYSDEADRVTVPHWACPTCGWTGYVVAGILRCGNAGCSDTSEFDPDSGERLPDA